MTVPLSRRAAVLLLLFPDIQGNLRAVLTLRSEHLRNFAGQVALPGGKSIEYCRVLMCLVLFFSFLFFLFSSSSSSSSSSSFSRGGKREGGP